MQSRVILLRDKPSSRFHQETAPFLVPISVENDEFEKD